MAELDAGTGVLTTFRKGAEHGGCGSEARYQWDGAALRRCRSCTGRIARLRRESGPPFPIDLADAAGRRGRPNGATPAP